MHVIVPVGPFSRSLFPISIKSVTDPNHHFPFCATFSLEVAVDVGLHLRHKFPLLQLHTVIDAMDVCAKENEAVSILENVIFDVFL